MGVTMISIRGGQATSKVHPRISLQPSLYTTFALFLLETLKYRIIQIGESQKIETGYKNFVQF